ncbi:MAG: hypothetical protein IKK27_02205 [Alistipes sp.]|nr:hypothetical protein [Alistipes sp.]
MFIIWLIALIAMIVSAIKSPVKFDRQIENTFESVFQHDEDILFEEFTEEELKEFHEQFEDYDTTSLQQDNLTLTLEGPSDNISQMKATVEFSDDGLRITDNEGELIEITTNGIKIGGEDFINYTTERSPQSDAIIFTVGGVTIRLEEAIKSAEEE